jgi:AcrR family transcriptional regulator
MIKRLKDKIDKIEIRVEKIGQSAAKLFNEKGYLETSMDDIADAVRGSKGGIYYYFSKKEEILFFILDKYMDRILENLEDNLEKIDDKYQKVQFIISHHIDLFSKFVAESKILLHDAKCLPNKYYKIVTQKEKNYYRIVFKVLEDLLGNQITKEKITALTFSLLAMCNWIYSWYNPKGPLTPQELTEIVFSLFTKGLNNFPGEESDRRGASIR